MLNADAAAATSTTRTLVSSRVLGLVHSWTWAAGGWFNTPPRAAAHERTSFIGLLLVVSPQNLHFFSPWRSSSLPTFFRPWPRSPAPRRTLQPLRPAHATRSC